MASSPHPHPLRAVAPSGPEPGPPAPLSELRSWSDERLVRAAPRHATAAWRELFRRHAPSVRAAAVGVVGPSSVSEDIVAEVFAALWRRPDRFDPTRGSLVGFLRMQARSAGIDWLRAETRRQVREENDALRHPPFEAPVEAALLLAEAARELWGAVAQLPAVQRLAIELAYQRGLTYRAVADQLGIPEGTAKTRIRSGLQLLRDASDQSAEVLRGVPAP